MVRREELDLRAVGDGQMEAVKGMKGVFVATGGGDRFFEFLAVGCFGRELPAIAFKLVGTEAAALVGENGS